MKNKRSQDYWNLKPLQAKSKSFKWKSSPFSWNIPGGPFFNFKDSDKDKVPDIWDCRPFDSKRKGPLHKDDLMKQSTLEDFGTVIQPETSGEGLDKPEFEVKSSDFKVEQPSSDQSSASFTVTTKDSGEGGYGSEDTTVKKKKGLLSKTASTVKKGVKAYETMFPESGISKKIAKGEVKKEFKKKTEKEMSEKERVKKLVEAELEKREKIEGRKKEFKKFSEGPSKPPMTKPPGTQLGSSSLVGPTEASIAAAMPTAFSQLTTPSVYTPYTHRRMQQDLMQRKLTEKTQDVTVFDILREEQQLRREQGLERPLPPIGKVDPETGEQRRVQPYSPVTTRQSFSVQPFIGKPPLEQPTWGQQRPRGNLLTDQFAVSQSNVYKFVFLQSAVDIFQSCQ